MPLGRARIAMLALLLATPALADDFSDFRIPAHRLFGWTGTLDASLSSQASNDLQIVRSGGGGDGNLGTSASWIADSDRQRTALFGAFSTAARQSSSTNTAQRPDLGMLRYNQVTWDQEAVERLSLTAQHRGYPWPIPVGWEISLAGQADYQQQWNHRTNDMRDLDTLGTLDRTFQGNQLTRRRDVAGGVNGTLGFGRVRDATAIFDARTLERRLRDFGALSRPLTPEARRRLAALMYTQGDLSSVRERPAKVLWKGIERILSDDGALRDSSLSSVAGRVGAEPYLLGTSVDLPRSPVQRSTGYFVGATFGGQYGMNSERQHYGNYFRYARNDTVTAVGSGGGSGASRFESKSGVAGVVVEYHRPLSETYQLDGSALYQYPLRKHQHGTYWSSSVTLRAIVADRWTAGLSLGQASNILRVGNRNITDAWQVDYGANATYYIEDELQLGLTVTAAQQSDRSAFQVYYYGDAYRRLAQARLNLTYRFLGRLDVPGVIVPQRIRSSVY